MPRSIFVSVAACLVAVLACLQGTAAARAPRQARDSGGQLLADAEKALGSGPFSVMQKTRVPPSGDKHDFLSIAPYWWPDPSKPGGLPYIRRDGEVNPESKEGTDDTAFSAMQSAAFVLARAYRESGQERFAARAALLLRTWFLDPATRMNPHLNFGQAVPGHNQGRGAGIIATRHLVNVVEAARILAASKAWSADDRKRLEAWSAAYATWLLTSPIGREEEAARNNHGTWYEAQLAALLLYTGKPADARARMETRVKERLASQIEPDGRQPEELARTRAWSYSAMNLEGWFTVARLAREAGVDLWGYRTRDGRSIRAALDYLVKFTDGAKWPYQQITPTDRGELSLLLREAAVEWKDAGYAALADRLSQRR
jgi:hypothetical protein